MLIDPSDVKYVIGRLRRTVIVRRYRLLDQSQKSLTTAAAAALSCGPGTIGLSVFNTVAIRRLAGEGACERVVAARLVKLDGWPSRADEFIDALDQLRTERASFSLSSWLDVLETEHGLDAETAYDVFVQVERELTVATPGAAKALEMIRSKASITFVSDVHFTSGDVRGLLQPIGLATDADTIVTSSDAGFSKNDGELFKLSGVGGSGLVDGAPFIGNNLWADATQAELASLKPHPSTVGNLTRFELAMSQQTQGLGPAIAGAARLQRLEADLIGDEDASIRVLGGQVIGQAILAFLIWARYECLERGIDQLVFLARDGELPLEMARAMPTDHWTGIQLRYLHCGRRAWSLAAAPIVGAKMWIDVGTADNAAFLMHSSTSTPFENLLDRCGLTIDSLDPRHELAGCEPSLPLTAEAAMLWRELLRSGDLDPLILAAAEGPRRSIVEFLKQSDFPTARTALVDVGWRGQQAWLISALVGEATGQDSIHLHFGGDRVSPHLENEVTIERFAFDDSREPHPISSPVACLEMFLASGKPRLLGYESDTRGAVREVFEEQSTEVDNPTRHLVATGAIEVASLFPTRAEIDSWQLPSDSLIPQTRELLATFWNTPTQREAELLAGLRFEGDDSGSIVGPVVQPYRATEVLGRSTQPRMWREGSLKATPLGFRTLVRIYFRLREMQSR